MFSHYMKRHKAREMITATEFILSTGGHWEKWDWWTAVPGLHPGSSAYSTGNCSHTAVRSSTAGSNDFFQEKPEIQIFLSVKSPNI